MSHLSPPGKRWPSPIIERESSDDSAATRPRAGHETAVAEHDGSAPLPAFGTARDRALDAAPPLDHPGWAQALLPVNYDDASAWTARKAFLLALKTAATPEAYFDALHAAAAWLEKHGIDQSVFDAIVAHLPRLRTLAPHAIRDVLAHCVERAARFGARGKNAVLCRLATACECLPLQDGWEALAQLTQLSAQRSRRRSASVEAALNDLRAVLRARESAQLSGGGELLVDALSAAPPDALMEIARQAEELLAAGHLPEDERLLLESAFARPLVEAGAARTSVGLTDLPEELLRKIVFGLMPDDAARPGGPAAIQQAARKFHAISLAAKALHRVARIPAAALYWEYCLGRVCFAHSRMHAFNLCVRMLGEFARYEPGDRLTLPANRAGFRLDQWFALVGELDSGEVPAKSNYALAGCRLLLAKLNAEMSGSGAALPGVSRGQLIERLVALVLRLNLDSRVRDLFVEQLLLAARELAPRQQARLLAEMVFFRKEGDPFRARVFLVLDELGEAGRATRELAVIMKAAETPETLSGPQIEAALAIIAGLEAPFSYGSRVLMQGVYTRLTDAAQKDIVLGALARLMEYDSQVYPPHLWFPVSAMPMDLVVAALAKMPTAAQRSVVTRPLRTYHSYWMLESFVLNEAQPWKLRRGVLDWHYRDLPNKPVQANARNPLSLFAFLIKLDAALMKQLA